MAKKPQSVDEYLQSLPPKISKTLTQVCKAVRIAAPDAAETIAYRIPYYKYHGALLAFVAHKNHCSLVTMSYAVIKSLSKELTPYEISGTTIRFPLDKPLPASLVKKIVKARIKENEQKGKLKK